MKIVIARISVICLLLFATTSFVASVPKITDFESKSDSSSKSPAHLQKRGTTTYARSSKKERRLTIVMLKSFTKAAISGYGQWQNVADYTRNHFSKWLEDRITSAGDADYKRYWQGFIALLEGQLDIIPSSQLTQAFHTQGLNSVDTYMSMELKLNVPQPGEDWDAIWDQAFTQMDMYLSQGLHLALNFYDADQNFMDWATGKSPDWQEAEPFPKNKRDDRDLVSGQNVNFPSDCILKTPDYDQMQFRDVPVNVKIPHGVYSSGCGVPYCMKVYGISCEQKFPPPGP